MKVIIAGSRKVEDYRLVIQAMERCGYDALGCNVLYPAYRSFPETFANDPERLYIPWSIDDAINKLDALLKKPHANMGKISDWTDGTIDRICDILEGKGHQWRRSSTDYRKHTREAKY